MSEISHFLLLPLYLINGIITFTQIKFRGLNIVAERDVMRTFKNYISTFLLCSLIACNSRLQTGTKGESIVAIADNNKILFHPLVDAKSLDTLIAAIGAAEIVLLGEASHGTSEYYEWRGEITKKLIEQKGFNVIALEADWSDTYRLNEFIKGSKMDSIEAVRYLKQYNRWPQWLWANEEFLKTLVWLNNYNNANGNGVEIYGLDVFSFEESLNSLSSLLTDTTTSALAQNLEQCLRPFQNDAFAYQRAVAKGKANCNVASQGLWQGLNKLLKPSVNMTEEQFLLQQNAAVVFNGERYFYQNAFGNTSAWNIRDRHMEETISRIVLKKGAGSKVIVWAHNTHIGDARYTDMPGRGRSNLAEMLRKKRGDDRVFIVGFGSYKGSVMAARKWDSAYEVMTMAPAQEGSLEQVLHAAGPGNKLLLSSENPNNKAINKWVLQRAIGVVQNPRGGLLGSYVNSQIIKRYNAFLYLDETTALHPLK